MATSPTVTGPVSGPASGSARTVLIVGNFSAASNRVCAELAARLSRIGWSVLTTSEQPGGTRRLIDMARTAWARRREYDVAQVDVYSGQAFLWAEAACMVMRHVRKPYVLTLHGGRLPEFSRRRPARVRRLLASAAAVTVPSRYLGEQMRGYGADLRLLPNGLDVGRLTCRARRSLAPDLVWLRAFQELYNPSLAVEVLSRVAKAFPHARLVMVGPDKGDGSLQRTQQAAAALGVQHQLSLPGAVPKHDVGAWLQRGDIFLNTTDADNTPGSVLEAMACGLCVVSTSVGGIPYLLTHETDALLVPPRDPDAMAGAVVRLLAEPETAARLSASARARAGSFDWSAVIPQWEQLLTAVVQEPKS